MRLLALGLVAALAACSPEIDLTADAALEAASAAAEAGDTRRAMALIDYAAETGDLDALAYREGVFNQGYVRVPEGYTQGQMQRHVALPVMFWHQWEARSDLEDALARGVEAEDATSLLKVAERLSARGHGATERESERDSARAIYRFLEDADVDPIRLAFLAFNLENRDEGLRRLEMASNAGDPTACHLAFYWSGEKRRTDTALELSDAIDYFEGCRSRALEAGYPFRDKPMSESLVTSLTTQAKAGNPASIPLHAELLETGVLERHPRLRPLLEIATDA